ncbi:MAG: CheR family methyltransferase [FCB group bacterium]|jgi:chemotaxis protein methyltransferase CheR
MAFTFFFRDRHTLETSVNLLVPLSHDLKEIKIWDAGCAMGSEPYTFAMLLAEKMGYFTFKRVKIHATDIDETDTFHKIIDNGVYSENELARIPKEILIKYFTKIENSDFFQVNDFIKNRIVFQKHNLLSLQPIDTGYNMIICKNVLLHLSPDERVEVINMFTSVLVKGGLFVTEQTQTIPEFNKNCFRQVVTNANVYEKI